MHYKCLKGDFMKKLILCIVFLLIPNFVFAKKSIKFGKGEGVVTDAKVHVYIDKSDPTPRCMGCLSFSFLVDDVSGILGSTYIEKIEITPSNTVCELLYSPQSLDLKSIFDSETSLHKSEQFEIEGDENCKPNNFVFNFTAFKRSCITCSDLVSDISGSFTGKDVLKLKPISPKNL